MPPGTNRRPDLFRLLIWVLSCLAVTPTFAAVDYAGFVAEVQAFQPGGVLSTGSAVPIAPDRLVTNCHVIRGAREIRVRRAGHIWTARTVVSDVHRDLCILAVPHYQGEIPILEDSASIRVGNAVVAASYSDKRFTVSQGRIKDLYTCPCNGGRVIQTSAAFDRGASGGGLFDRDGRLIGILTFKSTNGGDFHFALPVGWLGHLDQRGTTGQAADKAFWEQNPRNSGYFLAACTLEANQDWHQLAHLAGEWSRHQPTDPEAWMAVGRANLGLGRPSEAAKAFRHVLALDSTNADAEWELQKLGSDLGGNPLDLRRATDAR